ncbi:MAG: serine hydrolase domain-containing protein, partial [Rubripirellula sp.]
IDDPVHHYLTEFAKPPYAKITIHHLMTHTSGLPRTPEGEIGSIQWNSMSKTATPVGNYVRLAVQMPLKSDPGSNYLYSNFGFRVLSALIARVSGMSYADYMEQNIFEPLGMKNTGVARLDQPASESRIAEGLTLESLQADGPTYSNGERGRNFGTGFGSGGIFASAGDLVKWDRILTGDELLTKAQKKRLFQPVHGNYACGWKVERLPLDERLSHSHSGSNQGFFSKMMRLPEEELVIVIVGNVNASDAMDEVIDQLLRLCCSVPYRNP